MKCIVVGTGFGSVHAAWLRAIPDVAIDALIYGSNALNAGAMRAEHGIPTVGTDLSEALGRKGIDLVSIVSPPETHLMHLHAATTARVPVVIDKPLAQDLKTAQKIHALAEHSEQDVFVFFQWRLHAAARRMKELVNAEALGRLTHATAAFEHDFLAPNRTLWPWRHQNSCAGAGSLGDMGVHLFDLLRFVTGLEWNVTSASCSVAHPKRHAPQGTIDCNADDLAHVKLLSQEQNLTAQVMTSRVSLGRRMIVLGLYGTDGVASARFDPETGTASVTMQLGLQQEKTETFESGNPYEPIVRLLKGRRAIAESPARTADGLAAQILMLAAVSAAQISDQSENEERLHG